MIDDGPSYGRTNDKCDAIAMAKDRCCSADNERNLFRFYCEFMTWAFWPQKKDIRESNELIKIPSTLNR